MSLEGENMPVEIERIKSFVQNNIVNANNLGMECSDGRYLPEQSEGRIRIFGGDFGVVSAVKLAADDKGLNLPIENIFDRYEKVIIQKSLGRDERLHIHSHCGHIKTMSDKFPWGAELYGLFMEASNKKVTELEGKHEEKSVLFILGLEKSVNSRNSKGESHFVVDVDRIKNYFSILPEKLAMLPLTGQDIWNAYAEQMGKTKESIAADRKIYNVNLKGELAISPLA